MLSCIIPSYKDPLLNKTIQSILDNAEGEIEIICVLDGYWPEKIIENPKVKYLHLGKNRGMREAINAGVSISKGEFIMRTDEHCMFSKGFDKIVTENMQDNWIVTMRRFYLDPVKWEKMDIPPVDYERLVIQSVGDGKKFTGLPSPAPTDEKIAETQAMQGSCWIMKRSWWDKVIGRLQIEGYGPHLQDSHEMVFKTWKAGGKLMVNRNAWFAHKHVSFPRVHNYGGKEAEEAVKYSFRTWEPYYRELKQQWKQSV